MNEINQAENTEPTIESRLQSLNQILSGIRSHLVQGESDRMETQEKMDELRSSIEELGSQSQLSLQEQKELISTWQERVLKLEEFNLEVSKSSDKGIGDLEGKLQHLNGTLQGLRDSLEQQAENAAEPIDMSAFDKKIESVQEYYGVMEKHLSQLEDKQSQQLLRLQQLELSREEILAKTRELWSLSNEFKGSAQDQEGRLDFIEKEKDQLLEKLGDLELELATKFSPESEAWNMAIDRVQNVENKLENVHRELGLGVSKAIEDNQALKESQATLEQEKEALAEKVEKVIAFQNDLEKMKEQSTKFEEHVQSSQLGHEILLDGVKVELGTLSNKVEDFKKQFESDVEQKSSFLNKELVLARDSQYDQHQKVQKELDQVKQQQREIGNLKETIEEKDKESNVLKHEIRVLKNEMGTMYRQLNQQRTGAVVAIAAAILMSVGLSYIIAPSTPTQSEYQASLAMDTGVTQTFNEASLDLDAPSVEVEEVYLSQDVLSMQDSGNFFDEATPTEPIEKVNEVVVAPAFTKEEPVQAEVQASVVQYTVRDGDSLWAIAKKHPGESPLMERIEKIKRDNKLRTPDIKKGQVLLISI